VVDLPIHCNLIQTHCNAIQTLLQLNSHNSTSCEFGRYFSVARQRVTKRGFGGINPRKYAENSTDLCGIDLQCGGSGRSQVIDSS
jgi:hypothetical protein